MIIRQDDDNYLAHYGILRRSGRYPWGSGGPEVASNRSFLDMVDGLRKSGMKEKEVADSLNVSIAQLRAAKSIARNEEKQAKISTAQRLKETGMSVTAIGKEMKINESSVRDLLAPGQKDKTDILDTTTNMLKDQVERHKYIDVGVGIEHHIGLTRTKLNTAIARLKEEGYGVHYVKVEQLGTGLQTTLTVLAKPDTTYSEVFKNRAQIKQMDQVSKDGGRSFNMGIQPPISIDSKRVAVRYKEQGGANADGVIYIRPGVEDVSLGTNRYAQVRISVDGTHYLKGMAMYKDDLPPGVDLEFNTNKSNTGNKLDAMKEFKRDKDGNIDPENPFGAVIDSQITKKHADGTEHVTSVMNIVNDESTWERWSKSLSSQFLSKQSPTLAQTQLNMTLERKKTQLDEILTLTNSAVRKKLLEEFADSADSSSVHLKAAALPRQATHVILPVPSLKENQIYAPNFRNGEQVALVRHPHGGTFEIPELVVNNRNLEAKKLLGNATAAVGINAKVAQRLSGADFDGDTVLVIPNNNRQVKSTPALKDLKTFDPVSAYPGYPGMTAMTTGVKANEMGVISNLITDMTIRGANEGELARAVKHSMVVIDAEKHGLNYKQSALDNGIAQLKTKYQGGPTAGASTIISRAKSEIRVPERKPRSAAKGGPIDKTSGQKIFEPTGSSFVNPRGKTIIKTFKSTQLAEAQDAHALSSGMRIEKIYADHSNKLKDLANQARKAAVNTKNTVYSPSAKIVFAKEVATLDAKLNIALRNAPLERQAQVLANAMVSQKRQANPGLEPSEIKKLKGQELTRARLRTGAKKQRIEITDTEWDAIQAGAISNEKLSKILANSDTDTVKKLATPRSTVLMTSSKKARAKAMIASGYTQAEIASHLGVSLTTLKNSLK